jgi:molybdopterin-guanine dinucleotide biosynthesis protein A
MIDLLGDYTICVPRVAGRFHPLAAVYRRDVLPTVTRLLADGRLRTASLCQTVPARAVEATELADVDPSLLTLRNLNTPEEYAAALRDLAGQGIIGP